MRNASVLGWTLLGLSILGSCPEQAVAQGNLTGPERRVVRLSVGVPGDHVIGLDADFGRTARTSIVVSARVWDFGRWACAPTGPVIGLDGSVTPQPERPPCIPDGWSVSAGLRASAGMLFAEADLGLYRYHRDQTFMAPYGGLRAGLAPVIWSRLEVQLALHLILVSSYNDSGFDPDSWFLGAWDVGLGVPIG